MEEIRSMSFLGTQQVNLPAMSLHYPLMLSAKQEAVNINFYWKKYMNIYMSFHYMVTWLGETKQILLKDQIFIP